MSQCLRVGDVHDQRVVRGPALGGKDAAHRVGIAGIGCEAVDGLGRQADDPPLRQASHRPVYDVAPIVGLRQINPFRLGVRLGHR